MAEARASLGNVYLQKRDWDQAIDHYRESLKMFKQMGDIHSEATVWANVGSVYRQKREWRRAVEYYKQSLAIFEEQGDLHSMAIAWVNIAGVYLQTGQTEEARPLLGRAYLAFIWLGSPHAYTAARQLMKCFGSVEAASVYLAMLLHEASC
jgi:tetratricopeptide (TPR) repeat protein